MLSNVVIACANVMWQLDLTKAYVSPVIFSTQYFDKKIKGHTLEVNGFNM